MAVDVTDAVWLCDRTRGVFRWTNGNVDDLSVESALKGRAIQVAYADARGRVWFGSRDGTVVVRESGRFRTFDREDGLPGSVVNSLFTDRDGITWVATETGLARFDGFHFTMLTTDNGLPGRRVIWVLGDDSDGLWLGFSFGVLHIAAGEIAPAVRDPAHRLSSTLYDTDDGIAGSLEYGMPSTAVRTADGTLWFRTTEGVGSIDPARLTINPLPPPVVIEGMIADAHSIDLTSPVQLPPLTRRIEFDYAGLSLVAPRRVRFRYRLDGYDADWQDAGTRRQAIYTNLPPRGYRFHVIASNNDGIWSDAAASQGFALRPAFFQTIWFRFVVLFALVTGGWSAYRLRLRYLTSQLRVRFDERLAERTRIARELHDNLLQSVLGISLQVELTDELLPPDAPARRPLERALELSKNALTEGRRALNDLRSQTVDRDGVVRALSPSPSGSPSTHV